eukprot:CAMPEP_0170313966 /NCGR_PEP_ID=MMETSP0116_2-20130129/57550_1 /TAXON_ID=400756 /ORGANISM="Durinskia baltica, Strain CSIRO CS-38" /LENGTH=67 /DNA_ID=CAMNT_0010566403 /DNA_START=19 /DNA_END=222 /DNA_ORIENTATION=-
MTQAGEILATSSNFTRWLNVTGTRCAPLGNQPNSTEATSPAMGKTKSLTGLTPLLVKIASLTKGGGG